MLVLLPVNTAVSIYGLSHPMQTPREFRPDLLAIAIAQGVLLLLVFGSIAVNWHRYILFGEVPVGKQRLRVDRPVWAYMGWGLVITLRSTLIGLLIGFPLGLVVGLIMYPQTGTTKVIFMIIFVVAILFAMLFAAACGLRWSMKLVAVAVGRNGFSIKDGWDLTRDNHIRIGSMLLVTLLFLILLSFLVSLPMGLMAGTSSIALLVFSVAVQMALNWFGSILNVTLLTSLYGFFVEKRDF